MATWAPLLLPGSIMNHVHANVDPSCPVIGSRHEILTPARAGRGDFASRAAPGCLYGKPVQ
ncbi:nuclear hormone receptor family protein [Noviherbaspirillum galbum]|uniref:Uncharacterized protein n=1 Tax=Noviherbaspirillum galbum TaxID=2709383 RepID=A0A6B3SQH0_9BURK|nr:hypothetical protein [Noviherbaspirillum galbum]NEX61555.1 hypothetical protein [Noviherbaspirillum galbum]